MGTRTLGLKLPEELITKMMHYKAETKMTMSETATLAIETFFKNKQTPIEVVDTTEEPEATEDQELETLDDTELGAEKVD